jgi:hypothetical protein
MEEKERETRKVPDAVRACASAQRKCAATDEEEMAGRREVIGKRVV